MINTSPANLIATEQMVLPQPGLVQTVVFEHKNDIVSLVGKFIDYIEFDLNLSKETIEKYGDALKWLCRDLNYIIAPSQIQLEDITVLKKKMAGRGVGPCRINSVIFALRKFLIYCKEIHKLDIINPKEIRPMKLPKRRVVFLVPDEVHRLLESINTKNIRGLRMRALMEVLLVTGMRISEALSLNRTDIDWVNKEGMVIGKGNKQRPIYLNDRAIFWLKEYLGKRQDDKEALFITFGTLARLTRYDLSKLFRHYADKAGINKKITPHILRHTMATTMLHNGCDITFIKELLGHSDIQTTAQYYLGTDQRAVKDAHTKFLNYI